MLGDWRKNPMSFCKQCGNQLQTNDTFCNKCGASTSTIAQAAPAMPQPKKKSIVLRVFLVVLLLFVGLWVIGMIMIGSKVASNRDASGGDGTSRRAAQKGTPAPGSDDDLTGSYLMAEIGVKQIYDSARNPDSIKFSEIIITTGHSICYNYRGQNGFGGMNNESAVLSNTGDFKHTGQNGFEKIWNKECAGTKGWDRTQMVLSLYKDTYNK
jgi:hypothetical protein